MLTKFKKIVMLQVDEEVSISTGGRSSKGGTETVTTFKRTLIKPHKTGVDLENGTTS